MSRLATMSPLKRRMIKRAANAGLNLHGLYKQVLALRVSEGRTVDHSTFYLWLAGKRAGKGLAEDVDRVFKHQGGQSNGRE